MLAARSRRLGGVGGVHHEVLEREGVLARRLLDRSVGGGGATTAAPRARGLLAHGGHEVDRLTRLRAASRLRVDATFGLDVKDGAGPVGVGGDVRGGDGRVAAGLLAQPARLVIAGHQRTQARVELPRGESLPSTSGEECGHGPAAVVEAGGVPAHELTGDAAFLESLVGAAAQRLLCLRGVAGAGARGADDTGSGLCRDVFALGENRSLEPLHLLDGPAGPVRDVLGREPGADEGLDVARAQPAIDLDLQLAQAGAVTTGSSAHRLVQRDAVALSLGVGEENVLAVLVDADETEVLHLYLPGCGQVCLDCATPQPVDKAAHAGREARAGAG